MVLDFKRNFKTFFFDSCIFFYTSNSLEDTWVQNSKIPDF